jgi:hypothetical protein
VNEPIGFKMIGDAIARARQTKGPRSIPFVLLGHEFQGYFGCLSWHEQLIKGLSGIWLDVVGGSGVCQGHEDRPTSGAVTVKALVVSKLSQGT